MTKQVVMTQEEWDSLADRMAPLVWDVFIKNGYGIKDSKGNWVSEEIRDELFRDAISLALGHIEEQ